MRKGSLAQQLGSDPGISAWRQSLRLKSLVTRAKIARHLRRNQIAVAHAFDFYTNLTLLPAARLAGAPVVIGSQRQLGDLLTPTQFRVQADIFRMCDAIVCNSRAAAQRLAEAGVREDRLVVIGNGLAPELFASTEPALPRRTGILRGGHDCPHELSGEESQHFPASRRATRYKISGTGVRPCGRWSPASATGSRSAQSRGAIEPFFWGIAAISHLCSHRCTCPYFPHSQKVSRVLILESMAAGVPVVATNVGGNPELIASERGLLVEPDSDSALADALAHLLSDAPLRHAYAANSKAFASQNFSLDHMRRRHEELYLNLLERNQWSPRAAKHRPEGKKIQVAVVAASLRYVGGQSVQADLLIRNWKDDPELDARLIPIDPVFPRPIRWIERIPVLRTIVREPLYFLNLWRGLKDVDVAHIFSAGYWSFLIAPVPAWLIARLRGAKSLVHYHSGEARDHLQKFPSARVALARVDRVVVPSRYLVDVFKEFDLRAEGVPNVVDLAQIRFRQRKPLRPHLVCTRGFHPYYCVDVVVRAFAEVVREYPDACLDLVGKGPSEDEIRAVVRELGVPGVRFLGVASRQEIGRIYDDADIFINASRLDNMPVSVMEAFAAGTPVVTTSPECMPYLVEEGRTGLLSPVGDAHALAQNVLRVLRDADLASRLALNAYQESQGFLWQNVRGQWLSVYRSISGNEPS